MMNANTPSSNFRGGCGRSRGGQGRGRPTMSSSRSSRNVNRAGTAKTPALEMKFSTQYQGKTVYATYATIADVVTQYIQRTYKGGQDVAKSLEDMIVIDLHTAEPQRAISDKADATLKVINQTGLDIKYQEELRRHLDREDALKEGMNKAYALIFTNYCTKTMQARIEEHPDFKSTLKNDPIALLDAIKTVDARYRASTVPLGVSDRRLNSIDDR